MVVGGGGIGESTKSSHKTRITDLTAISPHFVDGPELEKGIRYPELLVLPDDTVLITGGSQDYGDPSSQNFLQARIYDAKTGTMRRVADPEVGRNYPSGSILPSEGRVITFGGDSLFADKVKTRPGVFEQRLEIYTPPYLYRDARPSLTSGPSTVKLGANATFTKYASVIKTARLIHPSSTTHVTGVEQRSIALALKKTKDGTGIQVTVPDNRNRVPASWYMLFVADDQATPAKALGVRVPRERRCRLPESPSELLSGPVQQTGADHRGLEHVAVGGVGWVGTGELVDAFQAVCQGAHAQRQAAGGLGGHTAGIEVGGEGAEERLGAAAGRGEWSEGVEDEVGHRLPVAGQHRVDEQVGGAQHRPFEAETLGQVEGVQCLLVRLHDPAGAWLWTPDGDATAVGGGVHLLGEVGEDLVLVAGGDTQQAAVLGGEQDAAVAEAGHERALHLPGHMVALVVGGRALCDGHRMGVGQTQAEALGTFGEAAQVAAAVEEVVDELPPGRLLLSYGESLGAFVALGEGVYRLLHGGECDVGRAGGAGPGEASSDQVCADEVAQPVAGVGGLFPQGAPGLDLLPGEAPAGGRDPGEDLGVAVQVVVGNPSVRHVAPAILTHR